MLLLYVGLEHTKPCRMTGGRTVLGDCLRIPLRWDTGWLLLSSSWSPLCATSVCLVFGHQQLVDDLSFPECFINTCVHTMSLWYYQSTLSHWDQLYHWTFEMEWQTLLCVRNCKQYLFMCIQCSPHLYMSECIVPHQICFILSSSKVSLLLLER